MISTRYRVLLAALLTATALTGGAAVYGQAPAPLWDATQLPETKGTVKQYTLTPRGEVNGLLLDNGTILRLPPPEAERLQSFLQPGQTVTVRGANLVTPLGTVMNVGALGTSPGQLTEFTFPPPGGPKAKGGPKGLPK